MNTGAGPRVSEALPDETWSVLAADKSATLVDVRTRAEWSFVGVPDLESIGRSVIFAEWMKFPDMSRDPGFAETVLEALGPDIPAKLFFICRSGVRSLAAAHSVAGALTARGVSVDCVNVVEGFEGDLNTEGHRGRTNGWKSRGLAWRQS